MNMKNKLTRGNGVAERIISEKIQERAFDSKCEIVSINACSNQEQ